MHLPEIKEGDKCIEGHMYRMDCNTCQCGEGNSLICTKMACLDKDMMDKLKAKKELQKHSLRKGKGTGDELPDMKKPCKPGKTYKKDCELCYCNENEVVFCSRGLCNMKLTESQMKDPAFFHQAFPVTNDVELPRLPHMSSECVPGKMYAIDCNKCLCTESGDLMCTLMLCVTPEGLTKLNAIENSGKPCKQSSTFHDKCIRCECKNGRTECTAISKCKEQMKLTADMSGKRNIKLSLDLKKSDKCVPKMIYRVHCNNCYCQEDGSLRCTVKACLNLSQVKKLRNQRLYLEKYGL